MIDEQKIDGSVRPHTPNEQKVDWKGRPIGLPLNRQPERERVGRQIPKTSDPWKILGHPIRRRVLLAFLDVGAGGVLSASEVSRRWYLSVGALSYHFDYLRQNGFLQLHGTVMVRGAVRHDYVLSAKGRRLASLAAMVTEQIATTAGDE